MEEGFLTWKGKIPSWEEQKKLFEELDGNIVRTSMTYFEGVGVEKSEGEVRYSELPSEGVSELSCLAGKVREIGALKRYEERKSGGTIYLKEGADFSHGLIRPPEYWVSFRTEKGKWVVGRLTEMNMGLSAKMANRNRNRGLGDFLDLYQIANKVLVKSVEKFSLDRDVKFSTYACKAMERKFGDMAKARDTKKKIPHDVGWKEHYLDGVVAKVMRPGKLLEARDFASHLMDVLSEKEKTVLDWIYFKGRKVREVADEMGFESLQGVRTIRDKALNRMRWHLDRMGYEFSPGVYQEMLAYARAWE